MNCFVVCDRKALSAKWEEISDDGAVILMPFPLRDAAFCGDDFDELTPQRKTRDGRNMSEFRNVEGIDITEVDDDIKGNGGQVEARE